MMLNSIILSAQMNESDDGSNLPTKSYENPTHGSTLTESSEKKSCLIIFARTTLCRHQQSQLQCYIRFRSVPTLESHKIPILGPQKSFCGYNVDRNSTV